MIRKINVGTASDQVTNFLQALEYEEFRYRQIINSVLKEQPKLGTETFRTYKDEHAAVHTKLMLARGEFEKTHVLNKIDPEMHLVGWYIDLDTHEVIAEVCDGKQEI